MFYSDGHINKMPHEELRFIMQNIALKRTFQNRQISKTIGQNELTYFLYEKIMNERLLKYKSTINRKINNVSEQEKL